MAIVNRGDRSGETLDFEEALSPALTTQSTDRTTNTQRINPDCSSNNNLIVGGEFRVRIHFIPTATGMLADELEITNGIIVAFEQASYAAEERDDPGTTAVKENEVAVKLTLDADPVQSVVIPLIITNEGGASTGGYSGVPSSVIFNGGETERGFTFTAAHDTYEDSGESVSATI